MEHYPPILPGMRAALHSKPTSQLARFPFATMCPALAAERRTPREKFPDQKRPRPSRARFAALFPPTPSIVGSTSHYMTKNKSKGLATMNLGRRQLLGAFAGTAATVLFPRSAAEAVVPARDRWGPLGNGILPRSTVAEAAIPDAPALLPRALAALDAHAGAITARDMVGIVDFSSPSRSPRFYIVDLAGGRVASTHLVAHGKGSDPANSGWVEHLSNRPGSEASCSGSFITGQTYYGKHGLSRRLLGLDAENNLANERGIVIHAATYVDRTMAAEQGRIGRSQGCFAVPQSEIAQVLDRLGPGRLLFAAR